MTGVDLLRPGVIQHTNNYGGQPAIMHRITYNHDHVTLDGKCAGLGRWGIGPCQNNVKKTVLNRTGHPMQVCGVHANKLTRDLVKYPA
jgi:hypothetical protein